MRANGLVSGDLTSITNLGVRYVMLEVPPVEWARENGGGVFVPSSAVRVQQGLRRKLGRERPPRRSRKYWLV